MQNSIRLLLPIVLLIANLSLAEASGDSIRIENASGDSFHYSIRRQKGNWSDKPFELGPGKHHTYSTSESLVVSYWTDKPRFATLEPNRTYRINDLTRGELRPVTTVLRPTGPDDSAPERIAPVAADQDTQERSQDVRTIRVLALADSTYRRIVGQWQQRIRETVAGASRYYESNFGIRFVVDDVQAWEYRGLTDKPSERWTRLLRTSPGEADIVLAFIGFGDYYKGEDHAYYVGHLGQGMPFGQHAMVSGERFVHPNRDKAVLIHELAHLFGAFHVDDKTSIMQFNFREVPTKDIIAGQLKMDTPLREIIQMTRNVDFRRGVASLDSETQDRIKALCRSHRRAAEKQAPDPIAQGHRYLKAREQARAEAAPAPDAGGAR